MRGDKRKEVNPLDNIYLKLCVSWKVRPVKGQREIKIDSYFIVRSESRCALIKGIESDVHVLVDVTFNNFYSIYIYVKQHFNPCLSTEYTEPAAHFNGNFFTDNQIYVP
jgi:uncharacterized protein related to proFAR isomerase